MRSLWYEFKERTPQWVWLWMYNLKYGIENLFHFLPTIWRFRSWDYRHNLDVFSKSLEMTANCIERYGLHSGKELTVGKIRRAMWIIDNVDNAVSLAEEELGTPICMCEIISLDGTWKLPDEAKRVFNRATEIEEELWEELWVILKGTDKYLTATETYDGEEYTYEIGDGTGIRNWWD